MLKILTSDKALHFLYSFFLASIWLPLGIGLAIGKEVYDLICDKKSGRAWRWKHSLLDILADIVGIILAIIVKGVKWCKSYLS